MVFMWKPQIGNQLEGILEKVRCPESEVPRADLNQESQVSEVSLPSFLPIKRGVIAHWLQKVTRKFGGHWGSIGFVCIHPSGRVSLQSFVRMS